MGEAVTLFCDRTVMPPPGTGASAEDDWWAGSRALMTMRKAFRVPDVTPSTRTLFPCDSYAHWEADERLQRELAHLNVQWTLFSTTNAYRPTLLASDRIALTHSLGRCYAELGERWSESVRSAIPQVVELVTNWIVADDDMPTGSTVVEPPSAGVLNDPTRIFEESRVPTPLEAADAVKAFFHLRLDELARVTGVKRTTYLDWRRTERVPRPSSVQRLMDVYGLTYTLVRELGAQGAAGWFRAGSPSPLEMLADGDTKAVERLARGALPSAAVPVRSSIGAFVPEN
jgi:transcriptional regulator with XRE-family HTH domain